MGLYADNDPAAFEAMSKDCNSFSFFYHECKIALNEEKSIQNQGKKTDYST